MQNCEGPSSGVTGWELSGAEIGNANFSAGASDGTRSGAAEAKLAPVVMVWVPRVGVVGLAADEADGKVTGSGRSTGDGVYSPWMVEGVTGSSQAGPRSCVADTGVTMSSGTLISLGTKDAATSVRVVCMVFVGEGETGPVGNNSAAATCSSSFCLTLILLFSAISNLSNQSSMLASSSMRDSSCLNKLSKVNLAVLGERR